MLGIPVDDVEVVVWWVTARESRAAGTWKDSLDDGPIVISLVGGPWFSTLAAGDAGECIGVCLY